MGASLPVIRNKFPNYGTLRKKEAPRANVALPSFMQSVVVFYAKNV